MLIGAAALAQLGCDRHGDIPPVTVSDSAGIEIVTYRPDVAIPEWRVGPEPVLSIGELSGRPEYELYEPLHALRLDDGRIVVANQGTEELRFYGPQGEHLRTVGRKGDGPGEFDQLWGMTRLDGDSLGAWDWSAKRLTVYSDDGSFARLQSFRDAGGLFPQLLGSLGDGSFAIMGGVDPARMFARGSGLQDDSVAVLRLAVEEGTVLDTLGPFPGRQQWVQVGEGTLSIRPVAFGREEHIDVASGRIWVGDDRKGEVRAYRPDGSLERITRIGGEPRAVTDADLARYREERLRGVAEEDVPRVRQELEEMSPAERLPAFGDLFADRIGRLWIAGYSTDQDADRIWTVHGPAGQPIGRVRLRSGMQPMDAGRDYLLVYSRDDLDVEHVILYGLESTGA